MLGEHQPLSSLPLHPRIISAAAKAGYRQVGSVLTCSGLGLARATRLSPLDVDRLQMAASRSIISEDRAVTASKLYDGLSSDPRWGRLSTGCLALDRALRGGVVVPGITEVAGVSAAGKTQLCLQLCLTVQLPRSKGGLGGGAVYISTEDAFPTKRLHQMAQAFAEKYGFTTTKEMLDRTFIEHAATTSALGVQLNHRLPSLLARQPGGVRLVVVDSLAALFRVEFTGQQLVQRAELLRSFAAQLQRLSSTHNVAVVCVNQVTADMSTRGLEGKGEGEGRGGVKPALGLAWADVVTVRLVLHRREEAGEEGQGCRAEPAPSPRTLEVVFAPHLPSSSLQYLITAKGLRCLTS